jgi:protein tyrosine phosphatase
VSVKEPANFHQIADSAGTPVLVYRGGALHNCDEIAYLQSRGITHVLQLDAAPGYDDTMVTTGGVTVRQFSFSAWTIGLPTTCGDVGKAMAYLCDEANWPIYVHCSRGKDRTGYIIGVLELEKLSRTNRSVLQELHHDGHGVFEQLLFGQIDRALRSRPPICRTSCVDGQH